MNYDFVSDYCYASSKVSRKSGDEKNIRNKEDRLYGLVVEHRNAESECRKFSSSWDSEFFLCPALVARQETSFSIFYRA